MIERRGREGGFTLLEVLVALSTFGLVLVLLFGGVRFAGRSVAAEQRLLGSSAEVEPVRGFLRQLLIEAQAIEGGPRALQFIGSLPMAWGRPGRFDIRLTVADGRLIAAWNPHRPLGQPPGGGPSGQAEVLGGVEAIAFSYLVGDAESAPAWRDTTTGLWTPPALVRVNLAYVVGPEQRRLDLVAAPGADAPRLVAASPRKPRD